MLKLYNEFKRRKMFRPIVAYASAAFVLMQVSQVVIPALHIPEWIMSLIVFFIVLGFPITFFFAWVYDITPEGIKKTSLESQDPPKTTKDSHVSKKIILPATGLLTIIGGAFWIWYSLGAVSVGSGLDLQMGIKKSIAILNFENLTRNIENDYFGSALTEVLRTSLAKLSKLDVKSRTISAKLSNSVTGETEDIASNLDYYIEGTISQVAEERNVNISIINARNQSMEWSGKYTFSEDEIMQYQDTILNNITQKLNIHY
ncbi:uncharacterized protein METZ01_LOCUS314058, partial [marine metagenome]